MWPLNLFCNHRGHSMLVQDWSAERVDSYWQCSNCKKVTHGIGNKWVKKIHLKELRAQIERDKLKKSKERNQIWY